eukprot:PhM_4_TR2089/c0_g1_i1/m.72294
MAHVFQNQLRLRSKQCLAASDAKLLQSLGVPCETSSSPSPPKNKASQNNTRKSRVHNQEKKEDIQMLLRELASVSSPAKKSKATPNSGSEQIQIQVQKCETMRREEDDDNDGIDETDMIGIIPRCTTPPPLSPECEDNDECRNNKSQSSNGWEEGDHTDISHLPPPRPTTPMIHAQDSVQTLLSLLNTCDTELGVDGDEIDRTLQSCEGVVESVERLSRLVHERREMAEAAARTQIDADEGVYSTHLDPEYEQRVNLVLLDDMMVLPMLVDRKQNLQIQQVVDRMESRKQLIAVMQPPPVTDFRQSAEQQNDSFLREFEQRIRKETDIDRHVMKFTKAAKKAQVKAERERQRAKLFEQVAAIGSPDAEWLDNDDDNDGGLSERALLQKQQEEDEEEDHRHTNVMSFEFRNAGTYVYGRLAFEPNVNAMWEHDLSSMLNITLTFKQLIAQKTFEYNGSVLDCDRESFLVQFSVHQSALQFAVAVQLEIMRIGLPYQLLKYPCVAEEYALDSETLVFKGARIAMSVHMGRLPDMRDAYGNRAFTGHDYLTLRALCLVARGGEILGLASFLGALADRLPSHITTKHMDLTVPANHTYASTLKSLTKVTPSRDRSVLHLIQVFPTELAQRDAVLGEHPLLDSALRSLLSKHGKTTRRFVKNVVPAAIQDQKLSATATARLRNGPLIQYGDVIRGVVENPTTVVVVAVAKLKAVLTLKEGPDYVKEVLRIINSTLKLAVDSGACSVITIHPTETMLVFASEVAACEFALQLQLAIHNGCWPAEPFSDLYCNAAQIRGVRVAIGIHSDATNLFVRQDAYDIRTVQGVSAEWARVLCEFARGGETLISKSVHKASQVRLLELEAKVCPLTDARHEDTATYAVYPGSRGERWNEGLGVLLDAYAALRARLKERVQRTVPGGVSPVPKHKVRTVRMAAATAAALYSPSSSNVITTDKQQQQQDSGLPPQLRLDASASMSNLVVSNRSNDKAMIGELGNSSNDIVKNAAAVGESDVKGPETRINSTKKKSSGTRRRSSSIVRPSPSVPVGAVNSAVVNHRRRKSSSVVPHPQQQQQRRKSTLARVPLSRGVEMSRRRKSTLRPSGGGGNGNGGLTSHSLKQHSEAHQPSEERVSMLRDPPTPSLPSPRSFATVGSDRAPLEEEECDHDDAPLVGLASITAPLLAANVVQVTTEMLSPELGAPTPPPAPRPPMTLSEIPHYRTLRADLAALGVPRDHLKELDRHVVELQYTPELHDVMAFIESVPKIKAKKRAEEAEVALSRLTKPTGAYAIAHKAESDAQKKLQGRKSDAPRAAAAGLDEEMSPTDLERLKILEAHKTMKREMQLQQQQQLQHNETGLPVEDVPVAAECDVVGDGVMNNNNNNVSDEQMPRKHPEEIRDETKGKEADRTPAGKGRKFLKKAAAGATAPTQPTALVAMTRNRNDAADTAPDEEEESGGNNAGSILHDHIRIVEDPKSSPRDHTTKNGEDGAELKDTSHGTVNPWAATTAADSTSQLQLPQIVAPLKLPILSSSTTMKKPMLSPRGMVSCGSNTLFGEADLGPSPAPNQQQQHQLKSPRKASSSPTRLPRLTPAQLPHTSSKQKHQTTHKQQTTTMTAAAVVLPSATAGQMVPRRPPSHLAGRHASSSKTQDDQLLSPTPPKEPQPHPAPAHDHHPSLPSPSSPSSLLSRKAKGQRRRHLSPTKNKNNNKSETASSSPTASCQDLSLPERPSLDLSTREECARAVVSMRDHVVACFRCVDELPLREQQWSVLDHMYCKELVDFSNVLKMAYNLGVINNLDLLGAIKALRAHDETTKRKWYRTLWQLAYDQVTRSSAIAIAWRRVSLRALCCQQRVVALRRFIFSLVTGAPHVVTTTQQDVLRQSNIVLERVLSVGTPSPPPTLSRNRVSPNKKVKSSSFFGGEGQIQRHQMTNHDAMAWLRRARPIHQKQQL